jgi:hypothetical protein
MSENLPLDRPHPGNIAGVVPHIGGVIHEHKVAILKSIAVSVIVHIPDVGCAGCGDRPVAFETGAIDQEDVACDAIKLILEDTRASSFRSLQESPVLRVLTPF